MQVAYGKFDPDLNPPPFSDWSKVFTAVEIDLFQYYSWKPKITAYFNSWVKKKGIHMIPRIGIRPHRSIEEYQDAISIWKEQYENATLFFSVSSGRKEWTEAHALNELRKLPQSESYFFEWGKSDTAKTVSFLKSLNFFQGWVVDPDWHDASLWELESVFLHFKLHGWSRERWIRRYGELKSDRILRSIKNRGSSILTLSYSGKVAEAPLFFRKVNF